MTSKLNPLRFCRTLSIRSQPLLSCPEQRAHLPIGRRCLSNDTTTRSHNPDHSIPPADGGEPTIAAEYVRPPPEYFAPNFLNAEAVARLEKIAAGQDLYDEDPGHKFGMPTPPGKNDHLQNRYSPVITQFTKLLMRDGKLSVAQRNMSLILNYLRMSSAPKVSPLRPLLPGSPPPEHLPLNPELYLTLAIDSVAPLLRVRNMKGMAGGGMALELPEPLAARQRRRIAIMWILDAVNKKKSTGSGRTQFANRIAEELVSVVEGRSTVWTKREMVHKLGTSARANLNHPAVANKRGRS
ncbi:ribosomal protein S7 domain-containing protein [Pseudomassariella vexata]|uniref:Small ribosomal subunit protein uS7m n=1 Tax=Pseudomassariella vexata TaxID=1141098 RepID=A0A1Y2DE64_9PEZI|nr:ribosomal protein S7 domain-containing protein [Pseudomassariella vexata]ORY57560.1 ribosomal protein S7 domain-containing protein [Pseudomassariella vexata]